jgi:hypothetical protein
MLLTKKFFEKHRNLFYVGCPYLLTHLSALLQTLCHVGQHPHCTHRFSVCQAHSQIQNFIHAVSNKAQLKYPFLDI